MFERIHRVSSLSIRIVAATLVSVLIVVPTVGYVATEVAATQTLRTLLDRVRPADMRARLAACEAAPKTWVDEVDGRFQTFAYDAETLRSHNPAAPPLDERLAGELVAGRDRPARLTPFDDVWGGVLVDRHSQAGPCAITQMRWKAVAAGRTGVQRAAVLVLLAFLVSCTLATMMLAVRPIVKRLRRVAAAAHHVGDPSYVTAGDKTEDAIGGLSAAMDKAHRRIVDDRSTLKDHLANIAHDIRTPLASLQLTLEQVAGESESDVQRSRLNAALDDLAYIDGLTNNLHLASKVERNVSPLDDGHLVDLAKTVDFVLARYQLVGRRRNIEVVGSRPDTAVNVHCDPWMIQQVIGNLVDNAVKYGNPGGHVAVVLERDDERFELTVLDDGPGVDPVTLQQLTERSFRSTEAIRRDAAGSGLGLAIALKVCELAGFSVALDHAEPHGLRILIEGALA